MSTSFETDSRYLGDMNGALRGALLLAVMLTPGVVGAGSLPLAAGEKIHWDVHFGAVKAGTAWAEVRSTGDGLLELVAGCKSAPWYERVYKVDDEIESLWDPVGMGSRRYRTRFREGGFHQDQVMDFLPSRVKVLRRQEDKEQRWAEKTTEYKTWDGAVEDPQTAFQRLRTLALVSGESYGFPVFSGRKTWKLEVRVAERESMETGLGMLQVIPVHVKTRHKGDMEQRGDLIVYFSDDPRRVPVRVVLPTNLGRVEARIVEYSSP